MIGMGYGRFAFTGVLPLMLNEGLLTLHEGNLAASANYAGYLIGALLLAAAPVGPPPRLKHYLRRVDHRQPGAAGLGEPAVDHYYAARRRRRVSAITLIAGSLWLLEHMGASSRGAGCCVPGWGWGYLSPRRGSPLDMP
ncbi:YbfB/YjiJ family MFS transporter [Klebsiella pneumoniae subsp. pneumoniae]|nr:YbfB/YjiJ family MFS transporter [Klebsiella pneumoniae subsp. pneumoniae]